MIRKGIVLPVLFALVTAGIALAAVDPAPVRELPIQDGGRYKPLDTFCREAILAITDDETIEGEDPVATVLSMAFEPDGWKNRKVVAVSYRPFRERLGLGPTEAMISPSALASSDGFQKMIQEVEAAQSAGRELTPEEKEIEHLYNRIATLNAIMQWRAFTMVPAGADLGAKWLSIGDLGDEGKANPKVTAAWTKLKDAWLKQEPGDLGGPGRELRDALAALAPGTYPDGLAMRLETRYNLIRPFRVACWLYFLTFLLLCMRVRKDSTSLRTASSVTIGVAYVLHLAGLALRVYLSGRGPISNLYESMIYMSWGAVTFTLIFAPFYGLTQFGLGSTGLATILIYLADRSLDPFIAPLVPVLRSNWLWFHVQVIILGYAGIGLAIALAHVRLIFSLIRPDRPELARAMDPVIYRAIQVGSACLGTGIVLGGIWADYSWGRYWGWDPKETWSLITLLCYLAVLHGRYAGWFAGFGTAMGAMLGVFPLLMTYYGVNFLLVGLHSYAQHDMNSGATFLDRLLEVPLWLKLFALAEVLFALAVAARQQWGKSRRSGDVPSAPLP